MQHALSEEILIKQSTSQVCRSLLCNNIDRDVSFCASCIFCKPYISTSISCTFISIKDVLVDIIFIEFYHFRTGNDCSTSGISKSSISYPESLSNASANPYDPTHLLPLPNERSAREVSSYLSARKYLHDDCRPL